MQRAAKFIACLPLRSKTLKRLLLVLSMLTFLSMFFAYKDKLSDRIQMYTKKDRRYESESSEDYGFSEGTDASISEEVATSVTSKPFDANGRSSDFKTGPLNLTKKSTAVTNKPHNVFTKPPVVTTKPLKVTAKPETPKPPVGTTKPPKVTRKPTTTKPHLKTAKPSPVTKKASREPPGFSNSTTKTAGVTIRWNVTAKPFNTATKPLTRLFKPTQLKSRSTPAPYMGDVYATDDTYLSSTCPNRIRDKLKNSNFKDIYIDTIPVLQWKKHATESEYQRLQMYHGAFGWKGVTWHIVNETLNLLNASDSGYLFDNKRDDHCVRCAVVGNGGILNGSGMGEEIDAHDYVFRVNGAITKGFEKDVGNRTSFFFFSTNTMMNSLNSYRGHGFKKVPRSEETRFLFLPDHDRDYLLVRAALTNSTIDRGRDKSKNPRNYFGENLTMKHFKILHPDFMRYLANRFLWDPILKTRSREIYRPSTGAAMLLAAVHTCDQGLRMKGQIFRLAQSGDDSFILCIDLVDAYGFMTPNYAKFSDHYFDKVYRKVVFYVNHSFRKEMGLWQRLHKAGVIKLYMRD